MTLQSARDLYAAKKFDEARQEFLAAIDEDAPNAHLGVGLCLMGSGKLLEAAKYLTSCGIDVPEIWVNAARCYSAVGDTDNEIKALTRVAHFEHPSFEEQIKRLVGLAVHTKNLGAEIAGLKALTAIKPEDLDIKVALASKYKEVGLPDRAIPVLNYVAAVGPSSPAATNAHALLAGMYKDTSRQGEALAEFQESYRRQHVAHVGSNLLMDMQYTHGVSLQAYYEQAREFSTNFLHYSKKYVVSPERLTRERLETGLHVAFLGGDFVRHSLANLLLEPISLLRHTRPNYTFSIFNNREREKEDAVSQRYKDAVDNWYCIHGMSNSDVAQLIYDSQVDVLIDTSGHTALNNMSALGYKPAPVQMGWVSGMMTPPAIETVNYFFTDKWLRPPCAPDVCHEMLLDLPAAYTYFPVEVDVPDVAPLPCDSTGHINFGSFNNPCKISPEVVRTWAKVLAAVPKSTMSIKSGGEGTKKLVLEHMAAEGVDASRLEFVKPLASQIDVMKFYTERVDIVLDTWPCAGCLTSAEAMWMGSPVVTYIGDTFLHRQTWTLINQIGHPELGSDTLAGFIKAAVSLALNTDKLRYLRENMRELMSAAPMRQPDAVARALCDGIDTAWVDWVNTTESHRQTPVLLESE